MRKTLKRATVVLALTPVLSVPVTATAFADLSGTTSSLTSDTEITIPAPDGDAGAVAAEIEGILTIGKTTAHAGSDGAKASGDALSLLGQQIAGGEQTGVGSKSGELIGTGATPLGDAEVAPWSAKVTDENNGYQAMAEAALAHLNLADVLELWVLHSKSAASWTEDASTGDAESDGAQVTLSDLLDVKVLHSEAHSTGKSKSVLLVVNGNDIVSSDDVNGACDLEIPSLIHLICLTATGGTGAGGLVTGGADGAIVDVGDGSLIGTVTGTNTSGGAAPADTPDDNGDDDGNNRDNDNGPLPHTNGPRGELPFTGSEVGRFAAIAAAFMSLGGAMVAFGRRRFGLAA
jgi:hypothetical protein